MESGEVLIVKLSIGRRCPIKLIIRWFITVVALIVAAWLVPGIRVEGTNAIIAFGIMAIILGLLNAFLRPVLQILAIPAIILTLGLFLLVINALMLMLSAWIARNLGIGFYVDGFWSAFWGSLIVSIVSFLLSVILPD